MSSPVEPIIGTKLEDVNTDSSKINPAEEKDVILEVVPSGEVPVPDGVVVLQERKNDSAWAFRHEIDSVYGVQIVPSAVVERDVPKSAWIRYLGIILALLSTLMFSFNQIIQKVLLRDRRNESKSNSTEEKFDPFNLAAWIFSFEILFTIPLLIYHVYYEKKELLKPLRPFKEHPRTIILITMRSIGDSGAFIVFFVALQMLELGDAIVIISSAPVFVYIFCRIFLKEPVGYVIIFTAALALGGVVIIAEPPGLSGNAEFDTKKLIGILFCLLATLGLSISMVTVRFMKTVYHGLLNIISYVFGSIIGIIAAAAFQTLSLPRKQPFGLKNDYFLIVSCSAITVAAQTLFIMALQYEQAGPVALIRTIGVILAFLWQMVFFNQIPGAYSAIGGAMIVVGVVVTIVRKWISTLPEDNKHRRRMAFLLK